MKMMSASFLRWPQVLLAVLLLAALSALAADGDLKLEAQLVWGTNDQPKDKTLKPVSPEVVRKLQRLPFKWDYYYVMNVKTFTAEAKETTKVEMSKDCEIALKNLGEERVELTIVGQGKTVGKITQSLKNGHLLVTGGNAENFSGWFVVLNQVK